MLYRYPQSLTCDRAHIALVMLTWSSSPALPASKFEPLVHKSTKPCLLRAGMLVSPHGSLIPGKDATMRQGSVGLETQASASGSLASSLLSHVHRVPLVSSLFSPLCSLPTNGSACMNTLEQWKGKVLVVS